MGLLDEIAVTLYAGEVLDPPHLDALKEIAGVSGLQVDVRIGREGVVGRCWFNSE